MKTVRYMVISAFLFVCSGMLMSCSDSGGDGTPDLIHVTPDNAGDLARAAYVGRGGVDLDSMLGEESDSVFDTIDTMLSEDVSLDELAAMGSGTYTLEDDCGGTARLEFSFPSQTKVNASVTFDNFNYGSAGCVDEATIDGKVSGSATFSYDEQEDYPDIYSATLAFSNVSVDFEGDEYQMDGTVKYDGSDDETVKLTVNATVVYVNEDHTIELIGYVNQFSYDDGTGTTTETVSGISADSQYGAVRVSTETNVVTLDGDLYPSSGSLLITGASTETGTSSARLVFNADLSYTVYCDEDGDGVYEWNSGELAW